MQPGAETSGKVKDPLVSGNDQQLPRTVVDGVASTAATEMVFDRVA